jgi:hypothetical protein
VKIKRPCRNLAFSSPSAAQGILELSLKIMGQYRDFPYRKNRLSPDLIKLIFGYYRRRCWNRNSVRQFNEIA